MPFFCAPFVIVLAIVKLFQTAKTRSSQRFEEVFLLRGGPQVFSLMSESLVSYIQCLKLTRLRLHSE